MVAAAEQPLDGTIFALIQYAFVQEADGSLSSPNRGRFRDDVITGWFVGFASQAGNFELCRPRAERSQVRPVRGSGSGPFRRRSGMWIVVICATLLCGKSPVVAADPLDDYKLAVGLYNKGRWKLAAETFEGFLKAAPEHPNAERARYYLGLTYFNAEDYAKARESLRAFAKQHPTSPRKLEAAYWTGYASFLANDFPAAEAELGEFVKGGAGGPAAGAGAPHVGGVRFSGQTTGRGGRTVSALS